MKIKVPINKWPELREVELRCQVQSLTSSVHATCLLTGSNIGICSPTGLEFSFVSQIWVKKYHPNNTMLFLKAKFNLNTTKCHQLTVSTIQVYAKFSMLGVRWRLYKRQIENRPLLFWQLCNKWCALAYSTTSRDFLTSTPSTHPYPELLNGIRTLFILRLTCSDQSLFPRILELKSYEFHPTLLVALQKFRHDKNQ